MDATCAKNLYGINDDSSIDKIALALEETIKELSEQYKFPRGIARAKFRRHFEKQQKETNEKGEDDNDSSEEKTDEKDEDNEQG